MKRIILLLLFGFKTLTCFSQQIDNKHLNSIVAFLQTQKVNDAEITKIVNRLIENPDLFNGLWKDFINQATKSESLKWKFLNDLNAQFKTFQATNNQPSALGMTYDFNFNYAKYIDKSNSRGSHTFGLSTKGNIAFNKRLNPSDFLETKVNYNWSQFFGGVIKSKDDTAIYSRLNVLRRKLSNIKDMQSNEAIALWAEFGNNLLLSNQFYYSIEPKFSFESNQDFSKTQFVEGLTIDLGAKAWKTNNPLSYWNIFDYPFALMRLITGTDKEFTIYGSTIPTVQLNFDYVVPSTDSTRKSLIGNTNPFPRIKFETSFRTFITRVKTENIFFNANYRFYHEVNAPEAIRKANLSSDSYFVMALQSTSGFYVSYSTGKLPFDARNDKVYSIGFNYKIN